MPKYQFMADMNISPLTIENLKKNGWDIVRVSDIMNPQSKDVEILKYARQHNQVVITQDIDFSSLLALGGYEKPSVISLRLRSPNPETVTQKLIEIIPGLIKKLDQGVVVTVDEILVRVKRLPVILE